MVNLILSKTLIGSAVADALRGGSSGYDGGTSQVGDTAPDPINLFISHDGDNQIEDVSIYVAQYSGTHGGDYSASADFTKLKADGDAGYGFEIDFDWQDASFVTDARLRTSLGDSYPNRLTIGTDAMVYRVAGEANVPSAPVAGVIGPYDGFLQTEGNYAWLKIRYVTDPAETEIGYRQIDINISFNFTS